MALSIPKPNAMAVDEVGLKTLTWLWQAIRLFTVVVGGVALILTDVYLGGAFYDSIFHFNAGPEWLQSSAPWAISLATSAAQIWMYQWWAAYKKSNLPSSPIEFIALGGLAILMILDTLADLGAATQLIYGDMYTTSVWPTGQIQMVWWVGAGVAVCLSLFAEPLIGYFVGQAARPATLSAS